MAKYSLTHYTAVKKIFRYLKGTRDLGLVFKYGSDPSAPLKICAFSDASFAETEDRKSVSGGLILINDMVVMWFSRLQKLVTLSTTESELVALIVVAQELLWTLKFLEGINEKQTSPVTIFEDNRSTIAIAKHSQLSGRTKHLDLRQKFIQQAIEEGTLNIEYCETLKMLADLLTKPLPFPLFSKHRAKILSVSQDLRAFVAIFNNVFHKIG